MLGKRGVTQVNLDKDCKGSEIVFAIFGHW